MSLRVLPATRADLPDIIAVCHAAFADDPFIGQIMPNVQPEVRKAHDLHGYRREMEMSELNGIRLKKIVDGEGRILGFAKWQYPYTLTPEQRADKSQSDQLEEREHPLPEGSNKALCDVFFAALRAKSAQWMDESKDYLLHIIGVLPTHQRKGLGAMLISEGLADADRDNARTYIEASPSGYELYLRYGWKQVDEIVIDIGMYGGRGVATEKLLLREPGGK